ncbi:MAG: AAA family ATPase [Desulfobacter sp.]|nr:MAG: AAA family ATPase [Desulfobacter sp.]
MYTQFFGLNKKPFRISTDPAFMWFGEKHKEALATLRYGILDNKGFLLLTGDVGTGKTSLINALIQSLGPDVICTTVPDPSLDKLDLLNYIAAAFGMDREFNSKGAFLGHFRNFLIKANENNKKVLLIIDEAQLLTQEMLEEIRLLSNIEKTDTKLINIFFIGQNEFNEILNRPQNRAVRQRMTLNYNIDPLTPEETEAYIRHRLKVAGTEEKLFDHGAVQEVFLYSGGFPRRINILCDHALLSGYVKEQRLIDASIISECAKELKIPAYVRNRDINGFTESKVPQPPRPAVPKRPHQPAPPVYPIQPPPYPYPAPPARPASRFPWTGVLVFASALLLIWVFMFPNHFNATLATIKKRAGDSLAVLTGSPLPAESPKQPTTPQEPGSGTDPTPRQTESQTHTPPEPTPSPAPVPLKAAPGSLSDETPEPVSVIIEKEVPAPPDEAPTPLVTTVQKTPTAPLPEKKESPPRPIPPLPEETIIIRFQYNTNDFTPKGLSDLEHFAKTLSLYPEAQVRITGHTDSQGYDNYNLKLSEFRANIVKSFLLGRGVKENQMTIEGRGGRDPIESNTTPWGRKMNRRVEIKVLNPQKY